METEFGSVSNYNERLVLEAVRRLASAYPLLTDSHLADVVCVALNRLPARYVRSQDDFQFYLSDGEQALLEETVSGAVRHAFEHVSKRPNPTDRETPDDAESDGRE